MRAWDQRRCVLLFMDGTRAMHYQAMSASSADSVYMRPMPVTGRVADSALVPYTYILAFSRAFFNRERDKNLIRLDSAHQSGYSGHNDKSCSLALRNTSFVSFAATCP